MSDKYIVTLTVDMEVEAEHFMDAKAKAIAKLEFCEGVECATAISAKIADTEECLINTYWETCKECGFCEKRE